MDDMIKLQKKVLEGIMKDMGDMMVETHIVPCCDDGLDVTMSMHKKPKLEKLEEVEGDEFAAFLVEAD